MMKDELFKDLVASAGEMVTIENGAQKPVVVHEYNVPDVKAIRQAAGKSQVEFAKIIGASYDTLKSWENHRRNPSGSALKLLTLINRNPVEMVKMLEANG
jgi:putative transcriptional regulator